ncbi:MAG: hypothetical protein ABIJ16_12585 [Bacteroidota bacterium]
MKSSLSKILSIVLGILLLISVVILVIFFAGGKVEPNLIVPVKFNNIASAPQYTGLFISWSYVLLIIAGASAIIFPIFNLVQQPKKALPTLIGLVVIGILFFIGYSLGDGTLIKLSETYTGSDNNPTTLKLTDAGLYTMYILIAIAVIGALYTEVAKVFKR